MRKVLETLIVLKAVDKASAGINKMFNKTNASADAFARKQRARSDAWMGRAQTAALTAGAIGGALLVPAKLAADFEQSIANVGAVSNATTAEMTAMGIAARKQGRETMYTASQSAEAMQFLAMAGLNAKQNIIALPGVLQLAAAGNLDLAQTADIATNIMSGMNMEVQDMTRIGDVLTRTFTSSNSTLESVAATMKYAAPIAADVGMRIETLAAMTGKLATSGIQGQMAGTALRGIMLRLSAPTTAAAKALRQLNVATVDVDGNLRDIPTVLAEMGVALDKLPSGKRMGILKDVFETEGTSAASKLISYAKNQDLQKYVAQIAGGKGAVTAQSVAERRMNTAMGGWLKFQSAIQDFGISVGNTLLPTLTEMAIAAAAFANRMSDLAQANPEVTSAIVKTVAVAGGLIAAFSAISLAVAGVTSTSSALVFVFKGLLWAVGGLVAAFGAVPVAIGAAVIGGAALLYAYWDDIKKWTSEVYTFMSGAGTEIGSIFVHSLLGPMGGVVTTLYDLWGIVTGASTAFTGAGATGAIDGSRNPVGLGFMSTPGASVGRGIVQSSTAKPKEKPAYETKREQPKQSTSLNYAPIINIGSGSEADKQTFRDMLTQNKNEIIDMLDRANANRSRISYQ